jgi:hypothetical protein
VNKQPKNRAATLWKPGESGNPAGRPIGARNKFSEDVIQAFALDWAAGGPEAIARVRLTDPSTYMRVMASILPKDVLVNVQQQAPGGLDPDQWAALRRVLDLIQASVPDGTEPAQVFETIENALRAEYAKPIDG